MEEAVSHAKKGIELVSRLPEGAARQYQELGLQIVLGQALATTRGYGAQEPLEAFLRARELCAQIGRPPHLVPVIWGLWQVRAVRFELDIGEELAREMRRLGEEENNKTLIFFACHMSGINHYYSGRHRAGARLLRGRTAKPDRRHGSRAPQGRVADVARQVSALLGPSRPSASAF